MGIDLYEYSLSTIFYVDEIIFAEDWDNISYIVRNQKYFMKLPAEQ